MPSNEADQQESGSGVYSREKTSKKLASLLLEGLQHKPTPEELDEMDERKFARGTSVTPLTRSVVPPDFGDDGLPILSEDVVTTGPKDKIN